ncbi:hypothetical protein FGO68_gene6281 [Halteria grandinella]|uniref:Uncharacterized protein n=1 Tax=Halteria grandinella TaxID=5974 RepID=A0A8J8NCX8_HALGN|nr:hypothetical protein FGO68_gene6281 [Halteria grandinella]
MRVFDQGDYAREEGLFIATEIQVTERQVLGECECEGDWECGEGGKCLESGYCEGLGWCPSNLNEKATKKYTIVNITQELQIEYFNVIQFGTDKDEEDIIYQTYKRPNENIYYPEAFSNALNITSLIEPGLNLSKGALFNLDFEYTCNLQEPFCDPYITLTKYSSLNEEHATFIEDSVTYYTNGTQYRDYYRYTGIRLLPTVRGEGKRLSIPAVILQVSSALALLSIATTISDVIMLNLPMLPEEHRRLYFAYKCENSEDFTNLQEKINLIKTEQQKRLKKIKRGEEGETGKKGQKRLKLQVDRDSYDANKQK